MDNLSLKIVKLLTIKKLKVSFAESCTGGLLASSITSISGSSKVFNLGLVTYSNNAKVKILKVPKKTINKYGAVSHETCLSMVKNLSRISKSNRNNVSEELVKYADIMNAATKIQSAYRGFNTRKRLQTKKNY